ncbi:MAG: CRISPR-associated helicase Cas3' [Muribaculaceae bacterium]|nr:CRISPR-associated helicase Cas3' [Muribaculaceae bacterium]
MNLCITIHISHLYLDPGSNDWVIQSNEEHSKGVAKLTQSFADKFGMGEWGNIIGLLHDKGKETKEFQSYIRRVTKQNTQKSKTNRYSKPYHSYVGALLIKQLYPNEPDIDNIANIIAGHHRGLYNKTPLNELLEKELPEELTIPPVPATVASLMPSQLAKDKSHIYRMLFSCLVDADYLDTEKFMNPEAYKLRGKGESIDKLIEKLKKYLDKLRAHSEPSTLNAIRNEIQGLALNKSTLPTGLFELTVPTGGGKTLTSILWALHHAKHNGMDRIIIAIPYTSIIEQTAEILKNIFGTENVLEHHSLTYTSYNKADNDNKTINQTEDQLKVATENWDYPIIVTTTVRLFESMFSHRPSACRRLHNIVNSVVILDEVQALPLKYYNPIISAINTYSRIFRTSWLFMSASQPVLSEATLEANGSQKFTLLYKTPEKLIPTDEQRWLSLRRVNLTFESKDYTYDEISKCLSSFSRVLCVVNTRKAAAEIFKRMPESDDTFHLSRLMYPAHIKATLKEIRARLKDPSANVRVIATNLIEAGVDLDFPVVFRQTTGLDSIIQAAGRCNREGRLSVKGDMRVFSLIEPDAQSYGLMKDKTYVCKEMRYMSENTDWFFQETMNTYFRKLYYRLNKLEYDENKIMKLLRSDCLNYESASKTFRLIEDASSAVVVNCEPVREIIEIIRKKGLNYKLYLALSQYSVSLHKSALNELRINGMLEVINGIEFISDKYYDNKRGISVISKRNLEDPLNVEQDNKTK